MARSETPANGRKRPVPVTPSTYGKPTHGSYPARGASQTRRPKHKAAFPYDTAPRHLIFDRDTIFSPAVVRFMRAIGTQPARTAYRCPWQNPIAERWIGSCRRELLDHVVVLGDRHLVRLLRSYVEYYHGDRSHLGLAKDAPDQRPVTPRPSPTAKVVALPRVGGLHHRYEWREAA